MPSENGQLSHEYINQAKEGLEIVTQPADQVEDKPQAHPVCETSVATEAIADAAEVVEEPQANPELETPEATPNDGDAEAVNKPEANPELEPQVAAEAIDGDAEVVDEKNATSSELPAGQVMLLTQDLADRVLVIQSNRKNPKQINNKLENLRIHGMLVPGVMDYAIRAHDAGYTLINPQTDVIVEDLEVIKKSLVIAEGNTRFHAWLQAIKEHKEHPERPDFEYKFVVNPSPDAATFKNRYRNMNLLNVPTHVNEFAEDALATEKDNKVLECYKAFIVEGLTPKAAGFACCGFEIRKSDLAKLFNGQKLPDYLANSETLPYFKAVFKAVKELFCGEDKNAKVSPFLKGTKVWRWTASHMNKAKDKKAESEKLIRFFEEFPARKMSSIMQAKKTDAQTVEQVVAEILEKCYTA